MYLPTYPSLVAIAIASGTAPLIINTLVLEGTRSSFGSYNAHRGDGYQVR